MSKAEKEEQQAKAWDLWLDCLSQDAIGDAIGVDQKTVHNWLKEKTADADFSLAPASRQHFDVWQFTTSDKDSGQPIANRVFLPAERDSPVWAPPRQGRPSQGALAPAPRGSLSLS